MKVTVHAAQRFLERVMRKSTYTYRDVNFSIRYLEKLLQNVVVSSYAKPFVLPGFENYKAIYRANTLITIVPKGEAHV
ncbi:hypothetical protein MLC52_09935 [Sulfurimonas sp. NW15]|uniref:hypothetical protein n=1 Tax=unclassified Sulfurimonas TaxID=2623549 RepID=UPI003204FC4E